jgi:hypothetical protein
MRNLMFYEEIYQISPLKLDLTQFLAKNKVFQQDLYFPLQQTWENKNEFLF